MIIFSRGHEYDKMYLFSELRKELEEKGEENICNFSFNKSEKYIYKTLGVQSLDVIKFQKNSKYDEKFIDNKYSKKEIEEMVEFEVGAGRISKQKLMKMAKRYLYILEVLENVKGIKRCIVWNNSFFYDRIMFFFCKKNGIKYFVLEQGYFRPFTLSFDPKGVNFECSIVRNREFFDNLEIDNSKLEKFLMKPLYSEKANKTGKYSKIIYGMYRVYDKLAFMMKKGTSIYDVTERSFLNSLKTVLSKRKLKNARNIGKLKKDYIFVPFQVEDDSQIILNSEKIKKMNELCTVVCNAVNKFNKKNSMDLQVVFKLHPADTHLEVNEIYETIETNKAAVLISRGDTKELIKKSELVITINSTVGIEALMEGKPVVTLGQAFYNIDGIASHCDDFDKLDEVIGTAMNAGADKNLIEKFLYYLRFDYFKEIHWRNPDKKSLKRLASDIL